jgi:xanthine dehydrogenase molybdenum-binding subunit
MVTTPSQTPRRTNSDGLTFKGFGKSHGKVDGLDKVTGRSQFGADFTLPGSLHGVIVRSPHAHARIVSIDMSEAEQLPGVLAVCTAADFPSDISGDVDTGEVDIGIQFLANLMMARRKVLFEGHPVAAVAATDAHVAADAARLVKVEYELLDTVTDPIEAMAVDAPILHEGLVARSLSGTGDRASNITAHIEAGRGDVEKGFAESDVIVEHTFKTSIVHQGYIEPEAETVFWQSNNHLQVWANTQGSFAVRGNLANLLKVDIGRITVTPLEVGGAFGAKTLPRVTPIAAILSRKSGKPVKIVLNREEVLKATGPGAAAVVTIKMGATKDGKLKAAQSRLVYGAGAFPGAPIMRGVQSVFACYQPENSRVDGYDVVTNTPRVAAYRAPGATVSAFCTEQVMDDLARKLGIEPIDFRIINASKTGDYTVDDNQYTRLGIVEMLEATKAHPAYTRPIKKSKNGWPTGRGVGIGWWPCGVDQASSRMLVEPDGRVALTTGSVDLSGVRTGLAQLTAETLGIEPDDVSVRIADTDSIPFTGSSAGSKVTRTQSDAVYKAGMAVLDIMRNNLASHFNVEAEFVEYADGSFFPRDNQDNRLSFKQASKIINAKAVPIEATASSDPNLRPANGYALNIADVEIDPDTGKVHLLDFTLFQDVGRLVNPMQVEGQMHGGAAQGIGWALNEEYVYDDRGLMRNSSLLDYRMPTALDLPMMECVILETPADDGPFGIRGVGEPPIIPPAAALANAVFDAIGVRMTQLPMNPERVFWAMKDSANDS